MTRRVCPRARAAARANAERLHRAIGTSEGMPLPPMTPRQRAGAMLAEARALQATGHKRRAWAVLREATALLRAAGVDVAELAVETGRGA